MGVPKFFRYISERYPNLSELVGTKEVRALDDSENSDFYLVSKMAKFVYVICVQRVSHSVDTTFGFPLVDRKR